MTAEQHTMNVLEINGLTVDLPTEKGANRILHGVDLALQPGRIHGLAGESGSGKTMTGLAVLGLLPHGARTTGRIRLHETDLLTLPPRQLGALRGRAMSMVFQDPSTSLHPMLSIGHQLTDHLRHHLRLGRKEARERAAELLAQVRIPGPREALGRYPHQFSGGMRQRIAIAIALACEPQVLIADEPTTALDVTVQAGVLRLLRGLCDELGLAVLLVTHDLGVMSAIADEVSVMRHGLVVETGPRGQVLTAPRHDYTCTLLDALPAHAGAGEAAAPAAPGRGTGARPVLPATGRTAAPVPAGSGEAVAGTPVPAVSGPGTAPGSAGESNPEPVLPAPAAPVSGPGSEVALDPGSVPVMPAAAGAPAVPEPGPQPDPAPVPRRDAGAPPVQTPAGGTAAPVPGQGPGPALESVPDQGSGPGPDAVPGADDISAPDPGPAARPAAGPGPEPTRSAP